MIFDSMEDDMNKMDDEGEITQFIMDFFKNFKIHWNLIVFIIMIISIILQPFYLGFNNAYNNKLEKQNIVAIFIIIEIILLIDIFFNFMDPFENSTKKFTVSNYKYTIWNYLSGWFLFDAIISLPLDTFYFIISKDFDVFYYAVKWISILRIVKIFDTQGRKNYFEKLFQKFVSDIEAIRIFIYCIFFIFFIHVSACSWISVGNLSTDKQGWMTYSTKDDDTIISIYLVSLFFTMTTTLTIGYGDITPHELHEKIFVLFLMSVGIANYSFLISSLSNIFGKMDLKMRKIQNFQDTLDDFYREYNFSYEYYEHIREVVSVSLKQNITGFNDMLDSLPFSVRTQLLLTMHAKNIANLTLFKKKPRDFILFLLPLLQPAKFKKNNVICSIEEILEEMFIVTKGQLSITLGSKFDNFEIYRIEKHVNFGNVLFYMNLRCPYEVICKIDVVEVLILNKINFLNCKEKFNEQMLKVLEEDLKTMYKIETRRKVIIELYEYTKDRAKILYCAEKIDTKILEDNLDEIIDGNFFNSELVNHYSNYLNAPFVERMLRLHNRDKKKSSFFLMLDHMDMAAEKIVKKPKTMKTFNFDPFEKDAETQKVIEKVEKVNEKIENENENSDDDDETRKAKHMKKKFNQQRDLRTLIMGNINDMCKDIKIRRRHGIHLNSDDDDKQHKKEMAEVSKNILNFSLLNNGFEKLLKSKSRRNQLRRSFYSNTKVWTKLVTLFLDPLYIEIEEFEEMKRMKEDDALKDTKLSFIKKMVNLDEQANQKSRIIDNQNKKMKEERNREIFRKRKIKKLATKNPTKTLLRKNSTLMPRQGKK